MANVLQQPDFYTTSHVRFNRLHIPHFVSHSQTYQSECRFPKKKWQYRNGMELDRSYYGEDKAREDNQVL